MASSSVGAVPSHVTTQPLDLAPRGALPESRFARDPLWHAAESGESLDLSALARAEGSIGLLEAILGGGDPARVALRALPFCPDAELSTGWLCDWAAATPSPAKELILRPLQAIVAEPPLPAEHQDVAGLSHCVGVLESLTADPALVGAERDFAVSALAMLRDHGISR